MQSTKYVQQIAQAVKVYMYKHVRFKCVWVGGGRSKISRLWSIAVLNGSILMICSPLLACHLKLQSQTTYGHTPLHQSRTSRHLGHGHSFLSLIKDTRMVGRQSTSWSLWATWAHNWKYNNTYNNTSQKWKLYSLLRQQRKSSFIGPSYSTLSHNNLLSHDNWWASIQMYPRTFTTIAIYNGSPCQGACTPMDNVNG